MAIGLTAPWMARALSRRPGFAAGRWFVVWNLLGILDLVVAVSIAGLDSTFATGAPGEITVTPMAQMPLVLVPAFLVPLFLMLHLTAGAIAPVPTISAEFGRSCPGSCPEFPGGGLGTLENEATFP
jgi:hypothetical protein